ncbi:hypothetical protein [Halovivax gelatinilyticus]|uniref:hypothetical protein n=1 Tax=Halovivax gelatinilyticus TaxID=2961597 RepID=UPI0020CA670F|nr:hypothetical protein [Halovivax gelatinilyticus]
MKLSLEGVIEWGVANERTLWIAAVVLYGVGDTATTFVGLSADGVEEIGPVAGPLMDRYGQCSLVGVKVTLFGAFWMLWRTLETTARVAVPMAVALVGALVTVWNLLVILAA